jgi:putative DNA primase/helicase
MHDKSISALPSMIINAASIGWKLFPLRARTKDGQLVKSWIAEATSDLAQLKQWAKQYPGCNWGMATGQVSGVFVADLDGPEGEAWARALALPESLIISTGKGCQVYFLTPLNVSIKNSVGAIAPGVDIRGDGGYVVLPPSIHPNGKTYTYLNAVSPLVAPDWLVELLTQDQPSSAPPPPQGPRQPATEAEKAYGVNIMKKACAEFAAVPAGKKLRNHAANKLAYTIAGVVAAGWVGEAEAKAAIWEVTADYRAKDGNGAIKTLNSGLSKGALKPCAPLPIHGAPSGNSTKYPSNQSGEAEITFMSELESEPLNWLWKNYLPRGKLTLIAGESKAGKSTITLEIAACVSTGRPFPDETKCKPGYVLVWSSEDGIRDTIIPRLRAMGADENRVALVTGRKDADGKTLPFNPATDMDDLTARAKRLPEPPALLIIDPAVATVGKGKDANQNNIVRESLQPVVTFAETFDCCVMGITHFKKDSGQVNILDRLISSIAWVAVARSILVVAKNKTSKMRIFAQAAGNLGKDDLGGHEFTTEEVIMYNRKGEIVYVEENGKMVPSTTTKIAWGGQVSGSAQQLIDKFEQPEKEEKTSVKNVALNAAITLISDAMPLGERLSSEMDTLTRNIKPFSLLKEAMRQLGIRKMKTKTLPAKGIWKICNELDDEMDDELLPTAANAIN